MATMTEPALDPAADSHPDEPDVVEPDVAPNAAERDVEPGPVEQAVEPAVAEQAVEPAVAEQAVEPAGVDAGDVDPTDLMAIAADIDWPDHNAERAARARQASLTKPKGSLGRLEELAAWVAAAQGKCPPSDFARARVIVFAGDHGVASAGVSAYPPEVTAQMVANILAGGAAVNVLARVAGASVRVVDIAVDADTPPEVARHKVRRSSGRIDREDALTAEELAAAIRAGVAIADEEIDGGADLLIAGDLGIGNTTPAAALISALTSTEPIKAVGRGSGIDDDGWMRKAAVVRDARRRAWPARNEPADLLRIAGGADLAAMTAFLLRASARRTPVLLDGAVVAAAALVAYEVTPKAASWWRAGHRSAEPAHALALRRLDLEPILELSMRLGEGTGALLALPVVRAAVRALAEMSTFDEAGVSEAIETSDAPDASEAAIIETPTDDTAPASDEPDHARA